MIFFEIYIANLFYLYHHISYDKKEIYINKTSSVNFILQNDERTFFKKGESLYLEGYSLDDILFFYNAKVKVVEKIEEGTNYYAYSSKLKYNEVIDGKIINLHIFIGKEKIILGFPVIFGSY